MNKTRYERRLRKGGVYIYDTQQERVITLLEVTKILNENNELIKKFLDDLDDLEDSKWLRRHKDKWKKIKNE